MFARRGFARLHSRYVHERRTSVLCERIAELLDPQASLLDVGAGDGLLGRKLLERRPDVTIEALEVVARDDPKLPVALFDGATIPRPARAVDVVLLVDVLHHAEQPLELLQEAMRVARTALIVKDVSTRGVGASATLHLMERLANAEAGIRMPEGFWSPQEWREAFDQLGLGVETMQTRLGLYPFPANLVFERRFHFLTRLSVGPANRSREG